MYVNIRVLTKLLLVQQSINREMNEAIAQNGQQSN